MSLEEHFAAERTSTTGEEAALRTSARRQRIKDQKERDGMLQLAYMLESCRLYWRIHPRRQDFIYVERSCWLCASFRDMGLAKSRAVMMFATGYTFATGRSLAIHSCNVCLAWCSHKFHLPERRRMSVESPGQIMV